MQNCKKRLSCAHKKEKKKNFSFFSFPEIANFTQINLVYAVFLQFLFVLATIFVRFGNNFCTFLQFLLILSGLQMSRGGIWVRPRFDVHVWNMQEAALSLEPTTTNVNEAFHSGFRKTVVENASFWSVIEDLKKLEAKTRVKFDEDAGKGQAQTSRQKQAEQAALDLRAVIENRENFPSKSHYLKRLGRRVD
jgi:hypothetical protein